MNVDVLILARLGSSRLSQKQLKKIAGIPAIKILIERIRKAKYVRKIIVCTTNLDSDDPLVDFLVKENISYFRGDVEDVIGRLLSAAKKYQTDIIVDVEGDKIYMDPEFVDKAVAKILSSNADIVMGSNYEEKFDPTDHFIHGLIPTVIRRNALEKIYEVKKTKKTETGYKELFFSSNLFEIKFITIPKNIKYSKKIRLTLDYQEDLDLANQIFLLLGRNFHLNEITNLFMNKPELIEITEPVRKNWEQNYRKNMLDKSLN